MRTDAISPGVRDACVDFDGVCQQSLVHERPVDGQMDTSVIHVPLQGLGEAGCAAE